MAVILDYTGFPHIFAKIVEYCDQPTQHQLRLLSSSAKDAVDQHHCRYIPVVGYLGVHEDVEVPLVGALQEPLSLTGIRPKTIPLLSLGVHSFRENACNVMWTLRNTRHIAFTASHLKFTWPNDILCAGGFLSCLGPRCTDLTLACNINHLWTEPHRLLDVPPTVRHLRILLITPAGHSMNRRCSINVTHTCPKVTVELKLASSLVDGLQTIVGLLTPCVEKLILAVHGSSEIALYLQSISGQPLHPDLHIIVLLAQPSNLQYLSNEWSQIIDAKIEVRPGTTSSTYL